MCICVLLSVKEFDLFPAIGSINVSKKACPAVLSLGSFSLSNT